MGKRGYKADDGYHKAARLVRASILCLRACARLPHTHISTLIPIRCSTAAARSALRRHGRRLANQARPRQLRCNRFAGMRGCCAKKLLNRPQQKVPARTLITPSQLVSFRHSYTVTLLYCNSQRSSTSRGTHLHTHCHQYRCQRVATYVEHQPRAQLCASASANRQSTRDELMSKDPLGHGVGGLRYNCFRACCRWAV